MSRANVLDVREGERERMSEEIVRCPYCVEGGEFRPMERLSNTWFVCPGCGHKATPGAQHSSCACPKCQDVDQVAIRCRTPRDVRNDFEDHPKHRAVS